MEYGEFIVLVADLVKFCFPFSLIFGLSAKLVNMALDMIFNRRIEF